MMGGVNSIYQRGVLCILLDLRTRTDCALFDKGGGMRPLFTLLSELSPSACTGEWLELKRLHGEGPEMDDEREWILRILWNSERVKNEELKMRRIGHRALCS